MPSPATAARRRLRETSQQREASRRRLRRWFTNRDDAAIERQANRARNEWLLQGTARLASRADAVEQMRVRFLNTHQDWLWGSTVPNIYQYQTAAYTTTDTNNNTYYNGTIGNYGTNVYRQQLQYYTTGVTNSYTVPGALQYYDNTRYSDRREFFHGSVANGVLCFTKRRGAQVVHESLEVRTALDGGFTVHMRVRFIGGESLFASYTREGQMPETVSFDTVEVRGNPGDVWRIWQEEYHDRAEIVYDFEVRTANPQTYMSWANWNAAYEETQEQRAERERVEQALVRQRDVTQFYNLASAGNDPPQELLDRLGSVSAEERAEFDRLLAEGARRREEHRRRVEADAEERRAADGRAEHLLVSLLSREQHREFMGRRCVTVPSRLPGIGYRLDLSGMVGNVQVVDAGRVVATLCVHIRESLPLADNVAAQLLAIQTDEDMFVGLANTHSGVLPEPLRQIASAWRVRRLNGELAA